MPSHELRDQFRKDGGKVLRAEGVLLAMENKTSLEEVLRVTHSEDEAAEGKKAPAGKQAVAAAVE